MTDSSLPPDPFGPPEEMISMMRGMYNLHSAAMASGFPEHIATDFITRILISLMELNSQQAAPEQGNSVE